MNGLWIFGFFCMMEGLYQVGVQLNGPPPMESTARMQIMVMACAAMGIEPPRVVAPTIGCAGCGLTLDPHGPDCPAGLG